MKRVLSCRLLWVLIVLVLSHATKVSGSDEITSLPGWSGPLPSKQYSGLLPVKVGPRSSNMHYWFVESEGDPSSDPVIMWVQGGPGATGLIGYFMENGPFALDDRSAVVGGVPSLIARNYSWSRFANLLYFEPASVGFSQCQQTGQAHCHWNDSAVAHFNYEFAQQFFTRYPQYRQNDFYLSGESYGGIFTITLATLIQQGNEAVMNSKGGGGDNSSVINLKGLAVCDSSVGHFDGNPNDPRWPDETNTHDVPDDPRHHIDFFFGHGMFSVDLYAKILSVCNETIANPSAACIQALKDMSDEMGPFPSYNLYNLCPDAAPGAPSMTYSQLRQHVHFIYPRRDDRRWMRVREMGKGLNDWPCGDQVMTDKWMNLAAVQDAIHVPRMQGWDYTNNIDYECNNDVGTFEHCAITDFRPEYKALAQSGVKVMLFSGDCDPQVPYTGTRAWVKSLGFPVKKKWHPWYVGTPKFVAGYKVEYDTGAKELTFATVRGAGHMVPYFRPRQAFELIQGFVNA